MLQSCVGMDSLERDVRGLERKLADLRNYQAEQTSEISSLEGRVRDLSGRLEDLEHSQRVKTAPAEPATMRPSLAPFQLDSATPPAIVPASTLDSDQALAVTLSRQDVAQAFGEALSNIRAGKFAEALPLLQRAQEQNYAEQGSAEIMFWKGVCYDGLGDNRRALAAYGELIAAFRKEPRAALGLLRQGSVFIRLGDTATAKLTFQKLIVDFPGTPEAAMAQQRLKDL